MAQVNDKIMPVALEDEMKTSYLDYSMSVIVSRALPDVRDGLKPVHRRVLFGMNDLGLAPNRPYKKCARIVGEVLGKYHPHGDIAVYDSLVRMAQEFSLRYPLVDGQGNFGSVDGDSPAAMRYTEARLEQIAAEMLRDIDKDTVNFTRNFDESLEEPSVLPSVVPNLLINGASGIAVGMATNIPPHNLGEIVDGLLALIANPDLPDEKLLKLILAPDFPTGGIIYGYEGVREAYLTGRGRIIIRAKAVVEETKSGREQIIITEIPYQVNKSTLIIKIAELVRAKTLEDISDIRDESDRDGMRIVIELKRDSTPDVVLNNLFKHTQLQTTFGIINLALVDGRPMVMPLRTMMQHFITFRNEVIVRRTQFDLKAAEARAHILEGFIIALDNIDEIIKIIKASKDVETAQANLMKRFKLSEIQSKAILDMRLQRLTGLERKKIEDEYKEVIQLIERLRAILNSKELQMQVIADELKALRERFADPRRTAIVYDRQDFSVEDLIAEEDVAVSISHNGFIKRFPVSGYKRQGRGGKGVTGASVREDDFLEHFFIASTHHFILFFTNRGRCYRLKVYDIPEASRQSKGRSIANLLQKENDEKVTALLSVKDFTDDRFITMATKGGTIKKVVLSAFENVRSSGIIAIGLDAGDELIEARLTDGTQDVILGTRRGMAVHFHETDVRDMGRGAAGVRGIRLEDGDEVICLIAARHGSTVLCVAQHGYGKRSPVDDFRLVRRGGKGVIAMNLTEKTGEMIAMKEIVNDKDDVVVVTEQGMVIRSHVSDIRVMGRNTQGVRLMRVEENDAISGVAIVPGSDEIDENAAAPEPTDGNGQGTLL